MNNLVRVKLLIAEDYTWNLRTTGPSLVNSNGNRHPAYYRNGGGQWCFSLHNSYWNRATSIDLTLFIAVKKAWILKSLKFIGTRLLNMKFTFPTKKTRSTFLMKREFIEGRNGFDTAQLP